ncbi:hypothetical protein C7974DRAFT_403919 [Boeremia exigua]|uniref:uncharacterized protein n=1 Tax=Boeremia exigua TaxID=749465 RepID=UPI001E8D3B8C|nr:uncharacterized protein C7974DRAFT_403919 [Boeremia exigua]KAH6613843.1 hypothetical protein C7974DRAFT_403919 [Boeremia exigua]
MLTLPRCMSSLLNAIVLPYLHPQALTVQQLSSRPMKNETVNSHSCATSHALIRWFGRCDCQSTFGRAPANTTI